MPEENNLSSRQHAETEKKKQEAAREIEEEFAFKQREIEHFKSNKEAMKWLESFYEKSQEEFIVHYAREKWKWHRYGPFHTRKIEDEENRWIDSAHKHLGIILQKKLFDLQCQWRADKIKLPGIQICYDFNMWEKDIFNCPVIDPITNDELEMYISYLLSDLYQVDYPQQLHIQWQYYVAIKKGFYSGNKEGYYPDWYAYNNERNGYGYLLTLPDIRGNKEEYYWRLLSNDYDEKNKEEIEEKLNLDNRPYLSVYDKEQMDYFVTHFENKAIQHIYKTYNKKLFDISSTADKEILSLHDDINMMLNSGVEIAASAHADWKESIRQAANTYRCQKIAEALPAAYEQYLMTIESGLGFSQVDVNWEIHHIQVANLTKARILNGEPGDLNF